MAVRAVPGTRPDGAGEEPATALSSPTEAHRGPHSGPTPPQAAALPRPPASAREVLGDVPTVATEAPGANVQARCPEVPRRRGRTAPSSHRRSKRRLVRGSSLLPDANPGGIHRASSTFGVEQASLRSSWTYRQCVKATGSPAFPPKTSACRSIACLAPLPFRHLRKPAQRVDQPHLLDRARA